MKKREDRYDLVKTWVLHQKPGTPLLPSTIIRDLRLQSKPGVVAEILVRLAEDGKIMKVFAVRLPSGVVLNRTYRTIDEIEPMVRGPLNQLVPAEDLEVLPAFERLLS